MCLISIQWTTNGLTEAEVRIKAYDQGLIDSYEASTVFERLERKYNQ